MKFSTFCVSTLACLGSAASDLSEYGLEARAEPGNQKPYTPCKKQKGCADGEVCFTSTKDGTNVCAKQGKGKCSYAYACLKYNKGVDCYKGHCYDVTPTQEAGQTCDVGQKCKKGMSCLSNQCRKTKGSKCSTSSECRSDEPCTNGKCGYAGVNEACKPNTLDCGPHLFYCSASKGNTCQKKAGINSPCFDSNGCNRSLDCVAGKCEKGSYQKACETGSDCKNSLVCKNGKCDYRGSEGAACSNGLDCEGGFLCENGKCSEIKHDGKCAGDGDCKSGEKCGMFKECCKRGSENC